VRGQRGGGIAGADGRDWGSAATLLPEGNALSVMADISGSGRIEQALRDRSEALGDADRVKTAFVSNMSYELRTPLTSIVGFAEMMQSGYAGELSEQAREYVDAIIASTTRLARLIDNVLDLTQGAAGGLPIERQPVEIDPLIREVAAKYEERAKTQGITLALTLRPSLGAVKGDERRLRQALEHVVDNAVRFVPTGGRVLIHGEGTHKTVRIVVSDDGPGIDSKMQVRLFDSFARFGRNNEGQASGLGLPLVRQFIEAHGGTVRLVSEPGQGTIVTLDLPRGD